MRQRSQQPAWICRHKTGKQTVNYKQLKEAILTMASLLREKDIGVGDAVGITAPNGPHWCVAALASWKVGASIAPIHINNSEHEIDQQIAAIDPKIMLAHESRLEYRNTLTISLDADHDRVAQERATMDEVDPDSVAARIYTSGSTGDPKVVKLSHSNMTSNTVAARKLATFSADDRFISLLPLSHVMGILGTILILWTTALSWSHPEFWQPMRSLKRWNRKTFRS
ncbi:MAG: AMP-binding protein [Gammaproteobacteria bacterium]|nr:AMP-binding protein [Gammaproteobacteria bacterium]